MTSLDFKLDLSSNCWTIIGVDLINNYSVDCNIRSADLHFDLSFCSYWTEARMTALILLSRNININPVLGIQAHFVTATKWNCLLIRFFTVPCLFICSTLFFSILLLELTSTIFVYSNRGRHICHPITVIIFSA